MDPRRIQRPEKTAAERPPFSDMAMKEESGFARFRRQQNLAPDEVEQNDEENEGDAGKEVGIRSGHERI